MSKLPEYKTMEQQEKLINSQPWWKKILSWIGEKLSKITPKISDETKWKILKGTVKFLFFLIIGGIFGVGLLTTKNWISNYGNKDRDGLEELADTYKLANKVDGGGRALTRAMKDQLDWRCEPTKDKTDAVCTIVVKKQEEVK